MDYDIKNCYNNNGEYHNQNILPALVIEQQSGNQKIQIKQKQQKKE
jgi:hypothetical protein